MTRRGQRRRRGGASDQVTPSEEAIESGADWTDRGLRALEAVVYGLAGLLLVATSLALLVAAGYRLITRWDDGAIVAAASALEALLIVFILLELLGAIREMVAVGELVAEPFLLVGIIAVIKEILRLAVEASRENGGGSFEESLDDFAVLGGLVLVLSVSALLIRRKEREPAELEHAEPTASTS